MKSSRWQSAVGTLVAVVGAALAVGANQSLFRAGGCGTWNLGCAADTVLVVLVANGVACMLFVASYRRELPRTLGRNFAALCIFITGVPTLVSCAIVAFVFGSIALKT